MKSLYSSLPSSEASRRPNKCAQLKWMYQLGESLDKFNLSKKSHLTRNEGLNCLTVTQTYMYLKKNPAQNKKEYRYSPIVLFGSAVFQPPYAFAAKCCISSLPVIKAKLNNELSASRISPRYRQGSFFIPVKQRRFRFCWWQTYEASFRLCFQQQAQ